MLLNADPHGEGDVFQEHTYADDRTRNYCHRFVAGERVEAGWINASDYRPGHTRTSRHARSRSRSSTQERAWGQESPGGARRAAESRHESSRSLCVGATLAWLCRLCSGFAR